MYFITKEYELVGKTIAFTHFAQFADNLTIVTDDGGVMVINVEDDGDEKNTSIYLEHQAKNYIMSDNRKWMLKELNQLGVITTGDLRLYEQQKQEKIEAARKQIELDREKHERQEYERLKAKFK